MAYNRTRWMDHVVQYPNRYTETSAGGNMVTEIPAPGEIIQQGTPQSAANFNNMEEGIVEATEMADYLATLVWANQRGLAAIKGEHGQATMTNSYTYPFNSTANTPVSVSLTKKRDTTDYTVETEVLEETGGCVGNITVFDKLQNGFKMRFDGSAKSVKVRYTVRGGAY